MPTATFTRERAIKGQDTVLVWIEFYHVNAVGAATTYRWAGTTIALDSTYKEPRVISFGHYERALSDRTGRLDGTAFSFQLSDIPDNSGQCLLRGFLGDPDTVALRNVEVVVRIIAESDLRAGSDPIVLFRGLVKDYRASAGFRFSFDCQDWLSARLTAKVPLWRIGDDFPGAPSASRDRKGPLWYGKVSDEASIANTPPVSMDEAAKGVDAVVGDQDVAGHGPLNQTAPTGVTASEAAGGSLNLGDVPNNQYRIMATRVVSGVESDPSPYLGDTVTVTITANGKKIQASCTNDGASLYRFYIGYTFFGAKWSHYMESATPSVEFTKVPPLGTESTVDNITPGGKLPSYTAIWNYRWSAVFDDGETELGDEWLAVVTPYRRPARTVVAPLTSPAPNFYRVYRKGTVGTFDRRWRVEKTQLNGDGNLYFDDDQLDTGVEYISGAPAPTGVAPVIHAGSFTALDGSVWDGFIVAAHAVKTILELYLDGAAVASGRYGVDVTAPDKAGFSTFWTSTRYRTANGHRYTLVYLRGPDGSAIADGSKRLTVNFEGVEATGDGTGSLLTSIYDQVGHFLDNFVLPQNTYAGANWLSTPTWTDSTPKRDTSSFSTVKTAAATVISAGDAAAWGVLTDEVILDVLAARMIDGDTSYGFTAAGQVRIVLEAPDPTKVTPTLTITETLDILDGSFDWEDSGDPSKFFNNLEYEFEPDYADDGSVSFAQSDTARDTAFQSRYKQKIDAPSTVQFAGRRGAGASGQIASRTVDRAKRPPRTFYQRLSLYALTIELGDAIGITHTEGPGATGVTDRLAQVRRIAPAVDLFELQIDAFDVAELITDGNLLIEEAMASRTLGGSRENDYGEQADGTYDIPEWRPVRVNWDQVPSGWVVRARVWCKNDSGASHTPKITDLSDTLVVAGASSSATSFTEQLITIARPVGNGEKFYKLRSTIASASAKKVWTFGEIEIVSS